MVFLASIVLFDLSGFSYSAFADEPILPPGLTVVQLEGNLVCPPLLLPRKGILVACDDRTLDLLGLDGGRLWRLEMDRLIHGPLFACTPSLTLLALSGDQIAAVRSDGTLAWQKRLAGSSKSWFLGSPEGRLVQVLPSGELRFLNPDGSLLFVLSAGTAVVAPPQTDARGIQLSLAGGGRSVVDWNGMQTDVSKSAKFPTPQEDDTMHFSLDTLSSTEYHVRIEGPKVRLEFNSRGSPGHWLVDNQNSPVVVWGDSLWRCFIFRDVDNDDPSDTTNTTINPSNSNAIRPLGVFENLGPAAELEKRFLFSLMQDDLANGTHKSLDHIESVLRAGKLAGRLYLYEDFLSVMMETNVRAANGPNQDLVIRTLGLLSRFPSTRSLARMVPLLEMQNGPAVVNAWLSWFAAIGVDPDGIVLPALLFNLPRWQTQGIISLLKKNLGHIAHTLGSSWPHSNESIQFFAWTQISAAH